MITREFRFRVWDTYNERMVYDPYLFRPTGEWELHAVDYRFNTPFQYYETHGDIDDGINSPCFVMQYTGDKDKNGNLIWEGDIVKRKRLAFDFDKADGEDHKWVEEISFVKYTDHGFWVDTEGFGWEGEDLWRWSQMEVIGNIYENPELLPEPQIIPEED